MTETERAVPRRLPAFDYEGESFTVDFRLRELRHLVLGETPEFVPFESKRGRELLRAFKASQSSPAEPSKCDVVVRRLGAINLVFPLTKKARSWVEEKVSKEGFQPNWPALVVENRYLSDLIGGMKEAGLEVNHSSQVTPEDEHDAR